jgi:hypothetical protein
LRDQVFEEKEGEFFLKENKMDLAEQQRGKEFLFKKR